MGKVRLADFSDGIIAIVITIMVLELKVPHGAGWHALSEVVPHFMIYLAAVGLAFAVAWISIAIYVSVAIIWLVPDCRIEKVLPDT